MTSPKRWSHATSNEHIEITIEQKLEGIKLPVDPF